MTALRSFLTWAAASAVALVGVSLPGASAFADEVGVPEDYAIGKGYGYWLNPMFVGEEVGGVSQISQQIFEDYTGISQPIKYSIEDDKIVPARAIDCGPSVGVRQFINCDFSFEFAAEAYKAAGWDLRVVASAEFRAASSFASSSAIVYSKIYPLGASGEVSFSTSEFYSSLSSFEDQKWYISLDGTVNSLGIQGFRSLFVSDTFGNPACVISGKCLSLGPQLPTNWTNAVNSRITAGGTSSSRDDLEMTGFSVEVVLEATVPLNPELPTYSGWNFANDYGTVNVGEIYDPPACQAKGSPFNQVDRVIPNLLHTANQPIEFRQFFGQQLGVNNYQFFAYLNPSLWEQFYGEQANELVYDCLRSQPLRYGPFEISPELPNSPPVEIPDFPEPELPELPEPPPLPTPDPIEPNPVDTCGLSVGCYFEYYLVPSQTPTEALEGLFVDSGLADGVGSVSAFIDGLYAGGVCQPITFGFHPDYSTSFQPCIQQAAAMIKPLSTVIGWAAVLWLVFTYIWGLVKPNLDGGA